MRAHDRVPPRIRALVAVAGIYGLKPRPVADGLWFALCPACDPADGGRGLVLRETPRGARWECRMCGTHGTHLTPLQRLAEARTVANDDESPARQFATSDAGEMQNDDPRAVLAAELAAIVARHGDRAREACDRIADPYLCRCAGCEGRDDRGEGDA